MDCKGVFRRYIAALANPDMLDEILTPDFVGRDLPPPGNRDLLSAFRGAVMQACPDQRIEILDIVAEGNHVAGRWRAEQTHTGPFRDIAATGVRFSFDGYEFVRLRDGRIAERWVALNPSPNEVMAQLGSSRQPGT
ncbi:MAG TPA: ester cyclase [Rhizomicrobium sp.]|nr:ester cyclase [Rhizomicrobium sp.]